VDTKAAPTTSASLQVAARSPTGDRMGLDTNTHQVVRRYWTSAKIRPSVNRPGSDRSGDLLIVKDADLLRRLLRAAGLTARQLSRDLGWASHSYANRILSGQVRTVRGETAERIAEVLQVPVALIFVSDEDG
jgi:hypothetical protein